MARNLQALLPLVEEYGSNRIAFCTDDRDPEDIAENGHINGMVREAVGAGIAPEDAVVLATLNPATWHRLWHLGAIAPGYQDRKSTRLNSSHPSISYAVFCLKKKKKKKTHKIMA